MKMGVKAALCVGTAIAFGIVGRAYFRPRANEAIKTVKVVLDFELSSTEEEILHPIVRQLWYAIRDGKVERVPMNDALEAFSHATEIQVMRDGSRFHWFGLRHPEKIGDGDPVMMVKTDPEGRIVEAHTTPRSGITSVGVAQ